MTDPAADPLLARIEGVLALGKPARARKMLIIVNPHASTMSARIKHLVVYALQGRYDVDAVDTTRKGHATEICRDASIDNYDVVCVFAGDGTVNEAANGLAGTSTPFTCLPGGATNVFCRILGIPNDVIDATEHLLRLPDRWQPRSCDLGMVDDHYFTFASGAGFDASVVEEIESHPRLKANLGKFFFTEATFATFFRHYAVNPPELEVEIEGRKLEGLSVVVQNARPFTYLGTRAIEVAENVSLDSGTLAGAVLTRSNVADVPAFVWRGLSNRSRLGDHKSITPFEDVTKFTVRTRDERPLPFQADGDYLGEHDEAVFSVAPGVLQVVT